MAFFICFKTVINSIIFHLNIEILNKKGGELNAHELEESEINPIRCMPLDEKLHSDSVKKLGMMYYSISIDLNEKNNALASSGEEKIFEDSQKNENFEKIQSRNEIFKEKVNLEENIKIEAKENSHVFTCNCDNKLQFEEKFFWAKDENEKYFENSHSKKEKEQKNSFMNDKYHEEHKNDKFFSKVKNNEQQTDQFFSLIIKKKDESNESESNCSSDSNAIGKTSFDLSEFCALCEKKNENEKHKHGPGCGHSIINHKGHIDYIVEGILHYPHEEHCDDHGKIVFV